MDPKLPKASLDTSFSSAPSASPNAEPRITLDVLDRVFAGEGTPEETAVVQHRLERYPALQGLFDDPGTYVDEPPGSTHVTPAPSWETMQARMAMDQASGTHATVATQSSSKHHRSRMRRFVMAMLAASATIAVSIGVWRTHVSRQTVVPDTYVTGAAQYRTILLSNGTQATLGPRTRVIAVATASGLDVTVNGHAHFRVTQQVSSPVIVHTRNAVVSVLGTTFSVRQYADEARSRIVVETGRVGVQRAMAESRAPDRAVLTAGMQAQVADSGIQVISGGDPAVSVNWANGKLVFDGATLREIVSELARVYGTEVRIADSALAQQAMLIEVSVKEQPLPRVLDFIGRVADAHYLRDGQGYVLMPGRVAREEPARKKFSEPQQEKQYGR